MSFKPAMSRSLVLKRGKVNDTLRLSIGGITIHTITETLVKSLGKVFDSTLRDVSSIPSTLIELAESNGPACCSAQNAVAAHDVPVSTVEAPRVKYFLTSEDNTTRA